MLIRMLTCVCVLVFLLLADCPLASAQRPPARPRAAPGRTGPIPRRAPARPAPVLSGEPAIWGIPEAEILYGATFDLTGPNPHSAIVEEYYAFVESDKPWPIKILAYCIQESELSEEQLDSLRDGASIAACLLQPLEGSVLRFVYTEKLQPNQHKSHGYLYEEFVLSAKPVWILLGDDQGHRRLRMLNNFRPLKDPFDTPGNRRMTTLHLPRNTFVSLDLSEREASPTMDVVHFPRQFFGESLEPRSFVVTRVNPTIPTYLRWSIQKSLSLGVESIVVQWLLLSIGTVTPTVVFGWLGRIFVNRRKRKRKGPSRAENDEKR